MNNTMSHTTPMTPMTLMAKRLQDRIRDTIRTKKTNVVLSADCTSATDVIDLSNILGPYILGVKLHSDIYIDYSDSNEFHRNAFIDQMQKLAKKHNFLIIEDRKVCDIGNTAKLQTRHICTYADLITVHGLPGEDILTSLTNNCLENECGILLIAQMSCANNLLDEKYTNNMLEMAQNHADIVVGFIAQEHIDCDFLTFSPGVNLNTPSDNSGQQYTTPNDFIDQKCTDVLIVGRGLYESADPISTVQKYIYTQRDSVIQKLLGLDIIKVGDFLLKSGERSDTYVDCRLLMKNTKIMYRIACEIRDLLKRNGLSCDTCDYIIAGVPLGGIPLSTMVSYVCDKPMMIARPTAKDYGTKRAIEGVCEESPRDVIIIEDVLTSGGSVLELIEVLEIHNYHVSMVVAVVDREQGAIEKLEANGIHAEALFTLSELKSALK